MPHTSRKKPSASQQHKRLEITDDSGWTHVTTGGNARRLRRTQNKNRNQQQKPGEEEDLESLLVPAEAPANVSLPDLQRQLTDYRHRWEQSSTWARVEESMRIGRVGTTTPLDDGIVCIGLGSPSGFLRGGWVDRRSVSMYQLAALVSIMGWMGRNLDSNPDSRPVRVYAQDPVFNSHDRALLASLDIVVLDHPLAFEKVSARTLLFCPGAERKHLEELLPRAPAVVFGGPLEDIDSDVVREFVQMRDSVQLPLFEHQEHAFWKMRVYFPRNEKG